MKERKSEKLDKINKSLKYGYVAASYFYLWRSSESYNSRKSIFIFSSHVLLGLLDFAYPQLYKAFHHSHEGTHNLPLHMFKLPQPIIMHFCRQRGNP